MGAGRDITGRDNLQQGACVMVCSETWRAELGQLQPMRWEAVRVGTTDDWREVIGCGRCSLYGMTRSFENALLAGVDEKFEGEDLRIMRSVAFALRTPSRRAKESL